MTGQDLTVRQLRWRPPGSNRMAARHRLELALEAGGNASALRPEAILCVRRLATSFADLDHISNLLDAELRDAARPARGIVPANANAVFFADRAELLACLARDWSVANLQTGWWWPVLFPRDDFTAVVRRWRAEAAAIPAALARLEAAGFATPFLRQLAPDELDVLWRQVVRTFGLSELERAWSALNLTNENEAAPRANPVSPPWASWVTPDAALSSKATRLLVTAVMLERAPAKVCSHCFAQALATWSASNPAQSALPLDSTNDAPPSSGNISLTPAPREKIQTPASESVSAPPPGDLMKSPDAEEDAGLSSARSDLASLAVAARATAAGRRNSPLESAQPDPGVEEPRETRLRSAPSDGTGQVILLPAVPQLDRIATEWGGVLYLVNLALIARLYGDFTNPERPGLALPLWDFLALLGERMTGGKFLDDPLPGFLARLACRSTEDQPGADFEPPKGESLKDWVGRISDEFEERVRQSIRAEPGFGFRELMLKHTAKIEASGTRVDAFFSLAAHPISLRLAGLDRDPGWVPGGRRAIYFHYD